MAEETEEQFLAKLPEGLDYVYLGPGHAYSKVCDKDGNWIGLHEWHYCHDPEQPTAGGVWFDTPEARAAYETQRPGNMAYWQVQSWDPLTIHPSIACNNCGNHGYIQQGKWVSA